MTTGTEPSGPRLLPVADGRRTRAVLGELLAPRRGPAGLVHGQRCWAQTRLR